MEDLQDPERAVAYLNAALEEGDSELFLLALQNLNPLTHPPCHCPKNPNGWNLC
jgi:hypothetical protein